MKKMLSLFVVCVFFLSGFGAVGISKEELVENIKDENLAELVAMFDQESMKELEEKIDLVVKEGGVKPIYAPGNFIENEFNAQMTLALKYRAPLPFFTPHPLPDEELKSIKVPTLLLIGDKEVIYELGAEGTIKKAEELVENIQTKLIPNAGHFSNTEQPELIDTYILEFLRK